MLGGGGEIGFDAVVGDGEADHAVGIAGYLVLLIDEMEAVGGRTGQVGGQRDEVAVEEEAVAELLLAEGFAAGGIIGLDAFDDEGLEVLDGAGLEEVGEERAGALVEGHVAVAGHTAVGAAHVEVAFVVEDDEVVGVEGDVEVAAIFPRHDVGASGGRMVFGREGAEVAKDGAGVVDHRLHTAAEIARIAGHDAVGRIGDSHMAPLAIHAAEECVADGGLDGRAADGELGVDGDSSIVGVILMAAEGAAYRSGNPVARDGEQEGQEKQELVSHSLQEH